MVMLLLPISVNGKLTKKSYLSFNPKKDSSIQKTVFYEKKLEKVVYEIYDFKNYKDKVASNESHSKYWIWQHHGGPACGKYQMESLARTISGYPNINKYQFYKLGYRDFGSDSINKKVFDKLWSLEDQEKAMDSLCRYMIFWLEKKSKTSLEDFTEELNKKGYPHEITDAMILGGMHFVGIEKFIYLARYGSLYSPGNRLGYTVWSCMMRYKNINLKRKKVIWKLKKLKRIKLLVSPKKNFSELKMCFEKRK